MNHIPFNDLGRSTDAEKKLLIRAMNQVLESGRWILGPATQAFEQAFADYLGVHSVVGVANGTDALEIALRALEVGPGDRVLTCANAGFYSSTAIYAVGAVPVYVDVDQNHLLMDCLALERGGPQGAKALVLTHLYGRVADVHRIAAWCKAHDVRLVEDCAQAHGAATPAGKAGTLGDLGCFSFYPTKNLGAMGDGGAIVTQNNRLADRVRCLRQYGWHGKYLVGSPHGRNSRLDEIQAAVLHVRLSRLDEQNARRRSVAMRYTSKIRHPAIQCPQISSSDDESYVAHLYVVQAANRGSLQQHLKDRSVATDVHYPVPDHLQSAYAGKQSPTLPVTERACQQVLSLPCFPGLTDEEVTRVVDACNSWVAP